MTITDQVKGAAAAVTDKVADVTGTNAQVRAISAVQHLLHASRKSISMLAALLPVQGIHSVWHVLQGDKDAHKATEAAHDKAAKGNVATAKGHAKDAAKQTLGAADAKKDQAKTGKTACVIAASLHAKQTNQCSI